MKVAVIGGGIVGLATAYCLHREGHEIELIEKRDGVGLETSYANGAQLCYGYVAPLAGPGVLAKLPRWFFDRRSSIRVRIPADGHAWRWGYAFLRACNQDAADAATRVLLALAAASRDRLATVLREEDLSFDFKPNGKLVVYGDAASFQEARRQVEFQRALECDQTTVDATECMEIEPLLASRRNSIAGGVYTPADACGDCHRLCSELARLLAPNIRTSTEAISLAVRNGEVTGVHTAAGVIEADRYIVAAGPLSRTLLIPLGIDVLLYPIRGYSLSAPLLDPRRALRTLRTSVTDFERKVVYAPLGATVRVAGMAEFDGHDARLDPARADLLRSQAQTFFPNVADYQSAQAWCGLRPMTPDGLPIVGLTPVKNLILNVGHGGLGFTLAFGCGQYLADLLALGPTQPTSVTSLTNAANSTISFAKQISFR